MKDLGRDNLVDLSDTLLVDVPKPQGVHLAQAGDLVFRSRGQNQEAALMVEDADDAMVAAPLFRVRPDLERVLPEYLLWWINQPISKRYLFSSTRGTLIKMISKQTLENLQVTLPTLEQQAKIAEILRLARREQQLTEKLMQLKKRYLDSVLIRMASAPPTQGQDS